MSVTIDYVLSDTAQLVRLAEICTADRRFIEKRWVESPQTIRELMSTDAFKDSLKRLQKGIPLSDGDYTAALFHAREAVSRKHKAKPVRDASHSR